MRILDYLIDQFSPENERHPLSNCRKPPHPVRNQNVSAHFVNQSERAYEIFLSVLESCGPVIYQSQHFYHLFHIINALI